MFGLVQDQSNAQPVRERERFFYLWPCNLRTFNAWLQLQTQWRYNATGKRTGLCYASVQAWLGSQPGLRPRRRAEVMQGLQAMEIAAINVWSTEQP